MRGAEQLSQAILESGVYGTEHMVCHDAMLTCPKIQLW